MAIRIRKVNGRTVALCAAKTKAKKGDIYIDDNSHYALSTKFACDRSYSWGINNSFLGDEKLIHVMAKEEKNNKKYWKKIFENLKSAKEIRQVWKDLANPKITLPKPHRS